MVTHATGEARRRPFVYSADIISRVAAARQAGVVFRSCAVLIAQRAFTDDRCGALQTTAAKPVNLPEATGAVSR